jgi:indolepyruvate ferredoxin oxidoreductase
VCAAIGVVKLNAAADHLPVQLRQLVARRLPLAVQVAQVPLAMRGYGHVKLANVALARTREAELLHRLDAARYPAPPRSAPTCRCSRR